MTNRRHRLGDDAEKATAAWLEAAGWRVLARRFRSAAGGEVDLVALDPRGVLVGLEVRARRTVRAGAPEETVDARHARRIGRSLASFAVTAGVRHRGLRIDLVAVRPMHDAGAPSGGQPRPLRLHLRRYPSIVG